LNETASRRQTDRLFVAALGHQLAALDARDLRREQRLLARKVLGTVLGAGTQRLLVRDERRQVLLLLLRQGVAMQRRARERVVVLELHERAQPVQAPQVRLRLRAGRERAREIAEDVARLHLPDVVRAHDHRHALAL
jgi:hypothetical protein